MAYEPISKVHKDYLGFNGLKSWATQIDVLERVVSSQFDGAAGKKQINLQPVYLVYYPMNVISCRFRLQIEHIHSPLNVSKAKATCSFPISDRFNTNKSFSPNKFYDLPSQFNSRPSTSRRLESSLERQKTGWGPHLSSSLDEKDLDFMRSRTSTFGISREDYYRGKKNESGMGPGAYELKDSIKQRPFYMGRKVHRSTKAVQQQPNCASYRVTKESYNQLSTHRTDGTAKMREEYYPKGKLQSYDNRVPGPGSYTRPGIGDSGKNTYRNNFQRKKANSSFGVGERMKNPKSDYLGPGSYNRFSEFGRTRY